jgi:hypothetical protein
MIKIEYIWVNLKFIHFKFFLFFLHSFAVFSGWKTCWTTGAYCLPAGLLALIVQGILLGRPAGLLALIVYLLDYWRLLFPLLLQFSPDSFPFFVILGNSKLQHPQICF